MFHPQVRCLVFHALQLAIADELRLFPTTAISCRVFLRVHGEQVRLVYTNATTVKAPESAEGPFHKVSRRGKSEGVSSYAEEAVQAWWITGEVSRSRTPFDSSLYVFSRVRQAAGTKVARMVLDDYRLNCDRLLPAVLLFRRLTVSPM